jgi:hypothetical protein
MQQNGSSSQIVSQHSSFSQPGLSLGSVQEPVPGQGSHSPQSAEQLSQSSLSSQLPLPQVPPHANVLAALFAQIWSQENKQQNGSSSQMVSQQPSSSHPGVSLGSVHEPVPGQPMGHSPQSVEQVLQFSLSSQVPLPHVPPQASRPLLTFTQMPSHVTLQQNGSTEQTLSQQASSLHPGVPLASPQAPSPGHALGHSPQSCGQLVQFSNPPHSSSPHSPPQPHVPIAIAAQSSFHESVQHNGSISQIWSQHEVSSQPGESWASQQASEPQPSPDLTPPVDLGSNAGPSLSCSVPRMDWA